MTYARILSVRLASWSGFKRVASAHLSGRLCWGAFAAALCWLIPLAASGAEPGGALVSPSRLDLYGDRLPGGALCRLGTIRFRHQGVVTCVVFSPDGKVLASRGKDGTVRLWDPSTGRPFRQFDCPEYPPQANTSVCFSPDSKRLAVAWKEDVMCVNLATGKETHWRGHREKVRTVVFSPDGKIAASGSDDGTIRLWDATSDKELHVLPGHAKGTGFVAFSPDGKTLISVGWDQTTRIWDVASGAQLRKIDWERPKAGSDPFRGRLECVAFSPDGKTAAIGVQAEEGEPTLLLCEVASGKVLRRLADFDRVIKAAAFSPDGALLAAAGPGEAPLIIWDAASGRRLHRLSGGVAQSLSFSPDGRTLASDGNGCAVQLWDVATGKEREATPGYLGAGTSAAFAPDGRTVATANSTGTVRLWDTATGRHRAVFRFPGDFLANTSHVWFSSDGRTFICPHDRRTLAVHDLATGREVRKFPAFRDRIQTFAVSPDGKLLAVRTFGELIGGAEWIHVLDAATGRELRRIRDPIHPTGTVALVGPLTFAPDGKVLASAFVHPTIRLLDPFTGKELCRMNGHKAGINQITFLPHGQLLASEAGDSNRNGHPIDHTNRLWDWATGRQLWVAAEDQGPFWEMLAPDGRTFVGSVRFGKPAVYEMATGKLLLDCSPSRAYTWGMAFSPDAQRLLTGQGNGVALIWDLAPQKWQAPTAKPSTDELQQCWADLAGEDAPRAQRAIYTLAHHGAPALAFLRQHLKPIPKDYADRLRQRIADLDADAFRTREQATRELTRLGPDAVLPLHAALKANPSPEAKNRIEALLKKLHPWYIQDAETLRTVRAIWVLQRIATPEARAVLDNLAGGAAEARITREAQAALQFLDRAGKP